MRRRIYPRPMTTTLEDLPVDIPLPRALSEFAHARIRACSVCGANSLLSAWSIPRMCLLSDYQVVWWLCHRLGLANPLFINTPLSCQPQCKDIPPSDRASPLNKPELYYAAGLLIHFIVCGCKGLSLQWHNSWCRVIVGAIGKELGIVPSFVDKLASDETTQNQVDAVYHVFHSLPSTTGVDATIGSPLAKAYIKKAAQCAYDIFEVKADKKFKKHTYYSKDEYGDRQLVVAVGTTFGGMGPDSFWAWCDGAYVWVVASEIAKGSTGRSALQRKSLMLQASQTCLIKANAQMVSTLSKPLR